MKSKSIFKQKKLPFIYLYSLYRISRFSSERDFRIFKNNDVPLQITHFTLTLDFLQRFLRIFNYEKKILHSASKTLSLHMYIRHDVILKVRVNFRENFLPIFIRFRQIHQDHCIKLVQTQRSLESYRRRISTIETITRKQQSKLSKRCWKIRISSISNRTHHTTIVEIFFTLSNANTHTHTHMKVV